MDWNNLTGTCKSMCPSTEMKTREKEGLLHKFEMEEHTKNDKYPKADPSKIIKKYSRPAAGQVVNNPSEVRPYLVLLKTINYLYNEIFPYHKEKPVMVYNFMFDRLRSVRQDMVIQNLNPGQCINILEPIVRFHAYFGYLLINEDINDYDPHINNTHLQECLKRLLTCYDFVNSCGSDDVNNYISAFNYNDLLKNQFEMECIYLLFNLGNMNALVRGMCHFTKNDLFKQCFLLSISWYLKNYVKVFNLITKLPLLLLCVVASHIPNIRQYSLIAMSNAYSSKNCQYPISHLKNLLMYNNNLEVIEECKHFNIETNSNFIIFLKSDFKLSASPQKPKRLTFIDEKLHKCNNLISLLQR